MPRLIPHVTNTTEREAIEVGARFADLPRAKVVDVVIIVSMLCDDCGSSHDYRVVSTLQGDEQVVYFLARCLDGLMDVDT